MFSHLSKIIVGALIICFSFTAVYVPHEYNKVRKAEAQQAVVDWAVLRQTTWTGVQATLSAGFDTVIAKVTSLQWWYDSVIKPLGWTLAKAILSRMLKDIVRWINSGFKGSPMFVQDLGGFLTSAADEAAGRFIQEVGGPLSIVCSPFRLNIKIAVSTAYSRSRDRNLRRCTLSGAMQNIQNFFGGDFSQGGWNTWLQIVHRPTQYTYLGAYHAASAEASIAIEGARGERLELARWAGGFLWGETCKDVRQPDGRVKQVCEVNTPGVLIQQQLSKHLGAGYDSLVAADQINEVVNAFLGQVVGQALSGINGLLGLGGNARYTNPSFNVDTYADTVGGTATSTGAFTMEDSVRILNDYIALASSTVTRLDRLYTDDDRVQARADATVAEARTIIPTLESQRTTLLSIISRYNQATSTAEQAAILQEYSTFSISLPSEEEVSGKRTVWDFGFSEMLEKPKDHVDIKTLREARTRTESYLAMANTVLERYSRTGSPTLLQTEIANRLSAPLPSNSPGGQGGSEATQEVSRVAKLQSDLSILLGITRKYEAGERQEARSEFRSLRASLPTEEEVSKARIDWELAFGPLQ